MPPTRVHNLTDARSCEATSTNTHLLQGGSHLGKTGQLPLIGGSVVPTAGCAMAKWVIPLVLKECWVRGHHKRFLVYAYYCCFRAAFLHNHPGGLLARKGPVEAYVGRRNCLSVEARRYDDNGRSRWSIIFTSWPMHILRWNRKP